MGLTGSLPVAHELYGREDVQLDHLVIVHLGHVSVGLFTHAAEVCVTVVAEHCGVADLVEGRGVGEGRVVAKLENLWHRASIWYIYVGKSDGAGDASIKHS